MSSALQPRLFLSQNPRIRVSGADSWHSAFQIFPLVGGGYGDKVITLVFYYLKVAIPVVVGHILFNLPHGLEGGDYGKVAGLAR